jgi:acyl-coenzyme A synthetase/AMP-(fatty) acid ligase/3-hydroxymyristoyl/3-hydroxydecanoyl-(acyl carrier protein) dehydratase
MIGLISTLLNAPAQSPLFLRSDTTVTAGQLRATAAQTAACMTDAHGDVFLHTTSAARFLAGVLAAAIHGKRIMLPAHAQPAYLEEIGCADAALLDDAALPLSGKADAPPEAFATIAHDLSFGFFTSGSTGTPKLVATTLSRLEIQVRTIEHLWGAQAGHVRGTVSHQHIYGLLWRMLWPVLSGRTADDEAALYWEELEGKLDADITLISSPAHLTRLPPHHVLSDRPGLVVSSGQALPFDAAAACAAMFGITPLEVLGSTETGGIAWRRQVTADAPWTPFPDVTISAGQDDALEVRSPYLMSDAPHQTGDGVALLPEGRFHLRPRGDRIEKIDGKRVSLERVETALAALPEISAIAALTLPRRKHALAAIVVLSEAGAALRQTEGEFRLSRHLRRISADALEPSERPKHWRFVDAIPTDAQGKRILSNLRALFDEDDPLSVLDLDVRTQSDAGAEIAFKLAPELIFFEGHFPARAILPGVAQAHIAALLAERIWGAELPTADLSRVKFRQVLQPNDEVVLMLIRDIVKQRLIFSYRLGEIEASRGEIGILKR